MPRSTFTTCYLLLILTLATLARGFPAHQQNDDDDNSSGPLPFIQFTKGGIRVNFGGYHAQAGLGGLLTGSKADGGLHASAGTPSGAHASAGLGGSLDGGPAGGLHARAGLGNGGPEARAGLAGSLAGPSPQGKIYAGSTVGEGGLGAVAGLDGTLNGPEGKIYAGSSAGNFDLEKTNTILRGEKSRSKNIQIITRNKKNEFDNSSASVSSSEEVISNKKDSSSSSSSSTGTIANATSSSNEKKNKREGKEDDESDEKSKHPARWYFKKRLAERVSSTNDKTTHESPIESSDPVEEAVPTSEQTPTKQRPPARQPWPYGIFTRSTDTNSDSTSGKTRNKGTLFDDIFNIPISALNAVNQLLKNHVGKRK